LEYITAIWYTLWPFGIHYGHLLYFMAIWNRYITAICYILWPFGNFVVIWNTYPFHLYQENQIPLGCKFLYENTKVLL
jgi:hypothetical protein